MTSKVYSVNSSYPLESILQISQNTFATVFPLDSLLAIYSTANHHPISTMNCYQSNYIDIFSNDSFITHGPWSLSVIKDSSSSTLNTQQQIVSSCIQINDKLLNIGIDGNINVYQLVYDHLELQTRSKIKSFRGRRSERLLPFVKGPDETVGLVSDFSQYLLYNLELELVQSSLSLQNICQLIPNNHSETLIHCGEKLYILDHRVNKLIGNYHLDNGTTFVKVANDKVLFSHDNKISLVDFRGKDQSVTEYQFSFPYRRICRFQHPNPNCMILLTQPQSSLDVYSV